LSNTNEPFCELAQRTCNRGSCMYCPYMEGDVEIGCPICGALNDVYVEEKESSYEQP